MTTRTIIVALLLSICACAGSQTASAQKKNSWPTCLGSICYGDDLPDAKQAVKTFGGSLHRGAKDDEVLCLRDGNTFLKLVIRFDIPAYLSSVYLSKEKICSTSISSKVSLSSMKTKEGLRVGQSFEDALSTYGLPNFVEYEDKNVKWDQSLTQKQKDSIKENCTLVYGPTTADTLYEASIHINAGQIVGIELSNSE